MLGLFVSVRITIHALVETLQVNQSHFASRHHGQRRVRDCPRGYLVHWRVEQPEVERFGSTMANTLAKTTAGDLLDNQRINLAVIANHVSSIDEVDGVTFFDNANNVIAMSGSQNGTRRFTATANIDDTITGYVSLHLNTQAFQPPKPWIRWLASLATVLATPWLTVLLMQLSARAATVRCPLCQYNKRTPGPHQATV